MRPLDARPRRRWALTLAALAMAAGLGADPPPRRRLAPVTPEVPGPVLAAIQEGRLAEAAGALDRLVADAREPDRRSYYRLLLGVVGRLDGKTEPARRALSEALAEAPAGPWAAKLRSELAALELAAGRPAAAEALARAEAEALLDPGRKDRLAGVYHAFARRLLTPDDPVTRPDPVAAYALLARARELARGEPLRASLLFAMARAGQAAAAAPAPAPTPNPAPNASAGPSIDPIRDFRAYLDEYPRGADRDLARFHLAEARLLAGQAAAARQGFADLARDLAGATEKDRAGLRARVLYRVARTYGVPAPPDDTQLGLGVAAIRRALADAPADPEAVRAAFEVGASQLHRGRADAAIEAFRAFLKGEGYKVEAEEARRDLADLTMTATFLVARTLQGQARYDEAIAAYRGYLSRFPDGPQWADAQRAILDAQLQAAADALALGKHAEARAAWSAFVAQNPLDPRDPQLMFDVGRSHATEKRFDAAIAAWELLVGKFSGSEPAAHAQFEVASIFEVEKGDPATAIERFRKVAAAPWKAQADQRVAVMESRALTVVSPRAFRSGETAHLKVTTRNLEALTFSAYKLDPEAYFRKKQVLGGVGSLDVGLVAPDAEWTVPVPGYGKFRPVESSYDLKVAVPGVYVVKVTDEKALQATALVIGSDLDAIVKVSADQVLVFAPDMKTGKGRKGARVLVANGSGVILDRPTGEDGVLLASWDKPPAGPGSTTVKAPEEKGFGPILPDAALSYLVLDGPDAAGSILGVPDRVSEGLSPRAYIYADRPAYRPGQEVALRGVVRESRDGQYFNPAGVAYKLEVLDSRGRLLVARLVTLSAFGTFHEAVRLDPSAPVGPYRVRLFKPSREVFSGGFEVQSYRLEKLDLAFELARAVYYRGEAVQADLVAKYQYGAPAAGRPVEVELPDGRTVRGATDLAGKFRVEFPTSGFAEEQLLLLKARLTGDDVGAQARVMLAVQGFAIGLETTRDVYLDGETFSLKATTLDALGKPTGRELRVLVLKQVTQAGRTTEREVSRHVLTTDKETGQGTASLRIEDRQGGSYVIRAAGTDQFGNPIVADRALEVSGQEDEERLRLLADRQSYKVGETATVNLHSRNRPGTALLAWEADRVLQYRLLPIHEGDNPVTWPVDGPQFPNFTLTAARMAGEKLDQARLDLRVERDLRVAIRPVKPAVGPGEEVEVEVTTRDQLDRPVAAEVALALVDRSLLRLYEDRLPPIGPFFHDQTRTGAFNTEATNTFRDEPATTPIPEAVVEDAERLAARSRDDARRGDALDQSREAFNAAANSVLQYSFAARGVRSVNMPADPQSQFSNRSYSDIDGKTGRAPVAPSPTEARPLRGIPAPGQVWDLDMPGRPDARRKAGLAFSPDGRKVASASDFHGHFEYAEAGKKLPEGQARRMFQEPEGVDKLGRVDQAPAARERFVETAYWNPSVVTGPDGRATVKFRAPMATSEYRFSARGVTAGDSLVGQADAALAVRKGFLVNLRAPEALVQGDRPRFVARLHHVGARGAAEVKLTAYSGDRQQVFPRTIELAADGVEELTFEPFEVPDADTLRLTLSARCGEAADEVVAEVPIRPWGVRAVATASGSSSADVTAFVGLPPGRAYEDLEMTIDLAPSPRRLLVNLAMGRGGRSGGPETTADRASGLLAAASALAYLREVRAAEAPEAALLADRVRGLAAGLISSQAADGGWPWVGPRPGCKALGSDPMASARSAWALAEVRALGLLAEPAAADRAAGYLAAEFNRSGADPEARAAILHGLAALGKAGFEQANALIRVRQSLPDAALADLALALASIDRPGLAGEALDVLAPRARTEPAGPGNRPRTYWPGAGPGSRHHRGPVESTALAALAFARVRPRAPEVQAAADWLLAHRSVDGWSPPQAGGAALAALAAALGPAGSAEDRYRLVVAVNEVEVHRAEVAGSPESRRIAVPRRALKAGDANRVRFQVEGRGTFGYAVTLGGFARDLGPEQEPAGKPYLVRSRAYTPAAPELEGRALPVGFASAVNPALFENRASQVARGARAGVRLDLARTQPAGRPGAAREFLIVEEPLPAGSTLIEGSVRTDASSFELADGVLRLYFAPEDALGPVRYEVAGSLPGRYRVPPTSIRGADEPGPTHLGPAGSLQVLAAGEPSTDAYRATPDELLARGRALFDSGRLAEAAGPLEELTAGYALKDGPARDVARMLLTLHIRDYQPRKLVQDFEVLREKGPEVVIPFAEVLAVGRAYRDIGEPERAYLAWRAIAEASYVEDARVGEALRQAGRTLEATAYLVNLWRQSPATASIEADLLGLAQVLAGAAARADSDPALRRELAEAGLARSDLLLQSIRLARAFACGSPRSPLAEEAGLATLGWHLELEDFDSVVRLAPRLASAYPKSPFLDGFQYAEALGRFALGQYDRAIEVASAIARATYKDANGVDQPSPNKWQALYILGQIHDARRDPTRAVEYYRQVADRFADAAGAVSALTRKELGLPEVAVVRPGGAARPAGSAPPAYPDRVELSYRNLAEAEVKVYPVDLMRLYLARRELGGIAGVDLAGITPLHQQAVKLGEAPGAAGRVKPLELPLAKEGAYLVMARGGDLYASGVVLVTPLELEVVEEADAGRVRVTVREAGSGNLVPKVQVKVIGSRNAAFSGGQTDLRGVYVAEGIAGRVTAVARQGSARYAFHRGTADVGPRPSNNTTNAPAPATPQEPGKPVASPSLDENLKSQNRMNQERQIDRLQNRYVPAPAGVNPF